PHWGPGAMAGKAILAMGKAVVWSAEYLIISRRLSSIKVALPCSDCDIAQQQRFGAMFDDLLKSRETYFLRCSLSTWEIEHDVWWPFYLRSLEWCYFQKRGLVHAYTTALPRDCHPWSPCINFMSRIAELSDSMRSAVLQARFLEAIVWVSGAQKRKTNSDNMLQLNVQKHSASSQNLLHSIVLNKFSNFVRISRRTFSDWLTSITVERMWSVVEGRLLEMHADAMLKLIQQSVSEGSQHIMDHYFFDSWESETVFYYFHQSMDHSKFLTSTIFDGTTRDGLGTITIDYTSKHSKSALSTNLMRNFLRCVGSGGDIHNKTVDYLAQLSYREKVMTLTQMIEHLIAQSLLDPSTVESTMVLFTPGNPDIARNIVQFFVCVSESLQSIENPLLDATISTILPFVANCWDSARIREDVHRRFYSPFRPHRRVPPPYRTYSVQFLNTIRSSDLSAVIDEAYRSGSWVQFLQPLFHVSVAAGGN
ncbi:hypothetical protein B0H14DRAFT_2756200, partial [Mycena olivaceomarginata]